MGQKTILRGRHGISGVWWYKLLGKGRNQPEQISGGFSRIWEFIGVRFGVVKSYHRLVERRINL